MLSLLASLSPACGEDVSRDSESTIAALRLEPLQLESIARWDAVPRDRPLLRDDDTGCTQNSCWLLHNDGPRALQVLDDDKEDIKGVGVIERLALDGAWHSVASRWICTCGNGRMPLSQMVAVPAGDVRQLGESFCGHAHPPLAAGEYRFLVPVIAEVGGSMQPGFVARRFTVAPQPQPERSRLRELLTDPRVPECAAERVLTASLVHGMDAAGLQALLASEPLPEALHEPLLDVLSRTPDATELLAGPLRCIGSPLGLRAATSLSFDPEHCTSDLCAAALAQLVTALAEDPPAVEVVDALAGWQARWPAAVLDRLVDLIGRDLDEELQDPIETAIGSALNRNDQQRARARALLAQRCQSGCASATGRAAIARLLQEDVGPDGAMASILGRGEPMPQLPELATPSAACAGLHSELREYARFLDGVPLNVELGDTQAAICDADGFPASVAGREPEREIDRGIFASGCSYVRALWKIYLQDRELEALLATARSFSSSGPR